MSEKFRVLYQSCKKIEAKSYFIIELISYLYFTLFEYDTRIIEYPTFKSKLQEYYDKQECDFEFEMDEIDWIKTFQIRPRGKCYYYDIVHNDGKNYTEKGVYRVIKEILFSDEKIFIDNIEQWYGVNDPIRILVKKDI